MIVHQSAKLDPVAVLHSLGVTAITDIAALDGGEDTAMWRVVHGGHASALRVMRAEQREAATREAAAMRVAQAAGIPVPGIEHEILWDNRPVFLLEWLTGYTVMASLVSRPWRAEALGVRFGRMQARIHAVSAPQAVSRQPEYWLQFIEVDEPALVVYLRALNPRTDALIHLDYHPFNVLVGNVNAVDSLNTTMYGTHVIGVIDWTNACAGDPRADVAYTATLLQVNRGMSGLRPVQERTARLAFTRGWQRGYQQIAGRLTGLAPFYAWAGAFIAKDVAHRLGQPGSMVTPAYLARLHRWTVHWKDRAGIA